VVDFSVVGGGGVVVDVVGGRVEGCSVVVDLTVVDEGGGP
jgi:hypothetical protein